MANATELATSARDQEIDKIIDETDHLGQIDRQYDQEIAKLRAVGLQKEVVTALIEAENKARKEYEQHLRDSPQLQQIEIDGITKLVVARGGEKLAIE